jgi:membrane-associated protease RseP (regulator of RpoE activity)
VDWAGLQTLADRDFRGSVYVLALLSDDLFAGEADLYTMAAAPAAALAGLARVGLDGEADLDRWVAGFSGPPTWERGWLGATPVDSALGGGPVIAAVDPEGPAAEIGLVPGDLIRAVGGTPPADASAVRSALEAAETGDSLVLAIERGGVATELNLSVIRAAAVAWEPDGLMPGAVVSAWLALKEADGALPSWLLALNRASVYRARGAWAEVVRALRGAEAPVHAGVGRATVDYGLGTALLETDPASYGEQARAALTRAATAPGGRLQHADGPSVNARAAARLAAMDQQ